VLKSYHYNLALNTRFKFFRYISSLIIMSKNCSYILFLNIYFTHNPETFYLKHNIETHKYILKLNNIQIDILDHEP